jgi:ATP-dependent RNA helicase RhlB
LNKDNKELPKISSLDIPESLLRSLQESGFTHCTPIQAESLPLALQGRDVAGQAQTGTGKTAAFLIAVYTHLLQKPPVPHRKPTQPRAIIIAPTRELAVQIHKDAEILGKYTGVRLGLVYGGAGYEAQRKQLEHGVDVVIGTPGRIIDYYKQKVFNLQAIQVVVLDEADRMFDLGFIKDIRYLLRRMPKPDKRLSMLFSATLSYRVTELAYEHMNNPHQVVVEAEQVTAENVTEAIYFPAMEEKIPLLLGLLKTHDFTRTMVFLNTKRAAERVNAYLNSNGYHSAVLSGDVPQKKRLRLLNQFTNGSLPIMIATDVAARGLHIPEVSHVINFDLPQDAEDYVHRIGRTARAGATGDAISFACEEYSFSLMDIEEYIGHKIPVENINSDMLVKPTPPPKKPRKKRSRPRGKPGKKNTHTRRTHKP